MSEVVRRPAHVVEGAVIEAIRAAAAHASPMDEARELALILGRMPGLQHQLRSARAAALRSALAEPGASLESVAADLRVSVNRLEQLLRE